jgi:hypothetical protein
MKQPQMQFGFGNSTVTNIGKVFCCKNAHDSDSGFNGYGYLGQCDGATTLSIMTFIITTLSKATLSIMKFSIMTLDTVGLSVVYAECRK